MPLNSIDDPRINWLKLLESMLVTWHTNKKNDISVGFLSNETYTALSHTVRTLPFLIKYLLKNINMKYILLSKFQTDSLERRFGHYRQMLGCSYLISVNGIHEQ